MSADAGADQRAMEALQATVKDLSARVDALEESPMDRAARGLEELTAKLPTYAEHLTQAEIAARAGKKDSA